MSSAHKGSFYDHRTRTVHLTPDASLYVRFHESAHKDQHESHSPFFLAWFIGRVIPGIRYLVTLAVEWNAMRRAKRVMEIHCMWSGAFKAEAERKFLSYLRKREQ